MMVGFFQLMILVGALMNVRLAAVVLSLSLTASAAGELGAPSPASTKNERAERMKEMKRRAEELIVTAQRGKAAFDAQPLFRYSDPIRQVIDATIWSIGGEQRPQVLLVMERYSRETKFWSYEMTVTSDRVPNSIKGDDWVWKPSGTGMKWKDLPASRPPGKSPAARLRQMKTLARRFEVSESYEGQTYHLKLKPQPLTTYKDDELKVTDGAGFIFAQGTNAEVVVWIEARRDQEAKEGRWKVGFSRLTAASIEANFDGKLLWTAEKHVGQVSPVYFNTIAND